MSVRCKYLLGSKRPETSAGFSLIEVLLSLFLLAVGMLSITAMQNAALQYNHAAFTESQALFLINDMVERIRANSSSSAYAIQYIENGPTASVDCAVSECTSAQLTAWDLNQWRNLVVNSDYLPNGESEIIFDTLNDQYTVSIRYDWSQLGAVDTTNGKRIVSVTTRISQ